MDLQLNRDKYPRLSLVVPLNQQAEHYTRVTMLQLNNLSQSLSTTPVHTALLVHSRRRLDSPCWRVFRVSYTARELFHASASSSFLHDDIHIAMSMIVYNSSSQQHAGSWRLQQLQHFKELLIAILQLYTTC